MVVSSLLDTLPFRCGQNGKDCKDTSKTREALKSYTEEVTRILDDKIGSIGKTQNLNNKIKILHFYTFTGGEFDWVMTSVGLCNKYFFSSSQKYFFSI